MSDDYTAVMCRVPVWNLSSFLEKNLRLLMDSVDDLSQETNKFFNYQRSLAKQQQSKQQYLQKRVTN